MLAGYASGDARNGLNALEVAAKLAASAKTGVITREIATEALQQRVLLYDKQGEEHYNLISALHKSVRNSDADAAMYWLAACSRPARIRSTSRAAWSAWPSKTSAWPRRRRCTSP